MIDPVQKMLAAARPLTVSLFPPTSRYYNLPTQTLTTPDGRTLVYLSRRFCPPPEALTQRAEHTVTARDRIDNLAAAYLGDPELAWQICDANRAMRPADLCAEPGRRLRITLPPGINASTTAMAVASMTAGGPPRG
jgi:hypothetical protein